MRHLEPTDEVRELAALYTLGVLPAEEASGLESHLAEGCRTCEEEVRVFSEAVGLLGHAAAAVTPRALLRDRLLSRLASGDGAWTIIRSGEGEWESSHAGMWTKRLFRDAVEGRFTALARLEAGVHYPSHQHAGNEKLYMLDGDLHLHGQVLGAGDFCAALAGSVHGDSSTLGGCRFLLVASERDRPVERSSGDERGLVFVTAGEGEWREAGAPGVTMRRLFKDPEHGTVTGLVRMTAGARLAPHRHTAAEEFYMLEGDAHVSGQVLRAGDYYRAPQATSHEVSFTDGGCTFLLISSRIELGA